MVECRNGLREALGSNPGRARYFSLPITVVVEVVLRMDRICSSMGVGWPAGRTYDMLKF